MVTSLITLHQMLMLSEQQSTQIERIIEHVPFLYSMSSSKICTLREFSPLKIIVSFF